MGRRLTDVTADLPTPILQMNLGVPRAAEEAASGLRLHPLLQLRLHLHPPCTRAKHPSANTGNLSQPAPPYMLLHGYRQLQGIWTSSEALTHLPRCLTLHARLKLRLALQPLPEIMMPSCTTWVRAKAKHKSLSRYA